MILGGAVRKVPVWHWSCPASSFGTVSFFRNSALNWVCAKSATWVSPGFRTTTTIQGRRQAASHTSFLWLIFNNGRQKGEDQTQLVEDGKERRILRFYLVWWNNNLPYSNFAQICSDLTIFSHQGEVNTTANKKGGESVKVLDANRSSVLRGDEEKLTLG